MSVKVIIQTTKGIIRDQSARRAAMFVLLMAAIIMAAAGSTFLNNWLMSDIWIFLLYWVVCAWLVLTAALMAVFDLLAVRLLLRREHRRIKAETLGSEAGNEEHEED